MLKSFQFRRLTLVGVLLLAGFAWLQSRLVVLHLVRHQELADKAGELTRTIRYTQAWRGEIRDRHGTPLAIPVDVVTVFANLTVCSNRVGAVAKTLAPLLGKNESELLACLRPPPRSSSTHRNPGAKSGLTKAVVLKRHLPIVEWENFTNTLARATFGYNLSTLTKAQKAALHNLRHKAVFGHEQQLRIAPYDRSASHLVGFVTNSWRLKGAYGVEAFCDELLAGTRGVCVSQKNAATDELPAGRRLFSEPENGKHVVLTIDLRLQQLVEQALAEAMRKHNPRSASAIIVRPRTGEILAWAVLPDFSPQNLDPAERLNWRNRSLSDRVEPGSTFKVITLAAALNEGLLTLDDVIFCENGLWHARRYSVRDHASYGSLTVRQCLAKSSNVAFAKIALGLGPTRLHRYLTDFGFGQFTGVPLPGETPGRIGWPTNWTDEKVARMGFGQGISVSQLQMTMAFSAIANNGRLMRPLLISRIESPQGQVLELYQPQVVRTVLRPETAQQLKVAMQAVVERGGTGALAALEDYTVCAKTGTAQKANTNGYIAGCYYSSFVGFFPAETAELCISVALDEPKGEYYASAVAVPVFREIARQAGRLFEIPSDKNKAPMALAERTTARGIPSASSAHDYLPITSILAKANLP